MGTRTVIDHPHGLPAYQCQTPATVLPVRGRGHQLLGVDDMASIAHFFVLLLRFLLPARGCHRAAGGPPSFTGCPDTPTLPLPRVRRVPLLRGEDTALIRPYVLAHEEWREERLRASRRRALLLASYGG
jgi:hypothetical protein